MGVVQSLTPAGRPRVRGRTRAAVRPATPQEWADYVASCDARRVVRGLSTVEYAWLSQISVVDRAALANQLRVALAELERIEQARLEVAP
jgi:hypothetical protein